MTATIGGLEVFLSVDGRPYSRSMRAMEGLTRQSTRSIRSDFNRTSVAAGRLDRKGQEMASRGFIRGLGTSVRRETRVAVLAIEGLTRRLDGLSTGIAGGLAIGIAARGFVTVADSATTLSNKLSVVSESERELQTLQRESARIARQTRTGVLDTADAYSRAARSASDFGRSQSFILRATETVQKGLISGGATGQEASSATVQLFQGVASNRLQGDELRSVLENAPALARSLARNLRIVEDGMVEAFDPKNPQRFDNAAQVSIGNIRELAKEGKLTGQVILDALVAASDEVDREFEKTSSTIAQGFTQISNAAIRYAQTSRIVQSASAGASNALLGIADNFDGLVNVFAVGLSIGGIALAARGLNSLGGVIKRTTAESLAQRQATLASSQASLTKAQSSVVEAKAGQAAAIQAAAQARNQAFLSQAIGGSTAATIASAAANQRLTVATTQLATAQTFATSAGRSHAAVMASQTLSARAFTVASTGLSSVVGFLGGPLGVAALAAAGLYASGVFDSLSDRMGNFARMLDSVQSEISEVASLDRDIRLLKEDLEGVSEQYQQALRDEKAEAEATALAEINSIDERLKKKKELRDANAAGLATSREALEAELASLRVDAGRSVDDFFSRTIKDSVQLGSDIFGSSQFDGDRRAENDFQRFLRQGEELTNLALNGTRLNDGQREAQALFAEYKKLEAVLADVNDKIETVKAGSVEKDLTGEIGQSAADDLNVVKELSKEAERLERLKAKLANPVVSAVDNIGFIGSASELKDFKDSLDEFRQLSNKLQQLSELDAQLEAKSKGKRGKDLDLLNEEFLVRKKLVEQRFQQQQVAKEESKAFDQRKRELAALNEVEKLRNTLTGSGPSIQGIQSATTDRELAMIRQKSQEEKAALKESIRLRQKESEILEKIAGAEGVERAILADKLNLTRQQSAQANAQRKQATAETLAFERQRDLIAARRSLASAQSSTQAFPEFQTDLVSAATTLKQLEMISDQTDRAARAKERSVQLSKLEADFERRKQEASSPEIVAVLERELEVRREALRVEGEFDEARVKHQKTIKDVREDIERETKLREQSAVLERQRAVSATQIMLTGRESVQDIKDLTDAQKLSVRQSERDFAIKKAIKDLGTDASPDQVARTREASGALFDLKAEADDAKERLDKVTQAIKAMENARLSVDRASLESSLVGVDEQDVVRIRSVAAAVERMRSLGIRDTDQVGEFSGEQIRREFEAVERRRLAIEQTTSLRRKALDLLQEHRTDEEKIADITKELVKLQPFLVEAMMRRASIMGETITLAEAEKRAQAAIGNEIEKTIETQTELGKASKSIIDDLKSGIEDLISRGGKLSDVLKQVVLQASNRAVSGLLDSGFSNLSSGLSGSSGSGGFLSTAFSTVSGLFQTAHTGAVIGEGGRIQRLGAGEVPLIAKEGETIRTGGQEAALQSALQGGGDNIQVTVISNDPATREPGGIRVSRQRASSEGSGAINISSRYS